MRVFGQALTHAAVTVTAADYAQARCVTCQRPISDLKRDWKGQASRYCSHRCAHRAAYLRRKARLHDA